MEEISHYELIIHFKQVFCTMPSGEIMIWKGNQLLLHYLSIQHRYSSCTDHLFVTISQQTTHHTKEYTGVDQGDHI